jgi:hypothetical protein
MRDLDDIVHLLETTPVPHSERIRSISSDAVLNICSVISSETVATLLKQYPIILSTFTDDEIASLKAKFQAAAIMGGWIYGLEHEVSGETIQLPSSPNLEPYISSGIKDYFYTQEKNSEEIIAHDVLEAFKHCKTECYKTCMEDACFNSLPSDAKMAIVLQYMWVMVMSFGAYKLQDRFARTSSQ